MPSQSARNGRWTICQPTSFRQRHEDKRPGRTVNSIGTHRDVYAMQPERTWSEGNLDMLEQRTVFEVPRYVVALVSHAQAKIARVYWGSFKTAWEGATDPQIEGVGWSVDTNPDPKKNR